MRIVVFGGSGFLGSHVADALTAKGHKVVIFDRVLSPFLQGGQEMVVGDILDQDKIRNTVAGADYVYHFAGIADIQEAQENPLAAVRFNVLGTTFILDACREFQVKRFLFASTVYVYSEHGSFYRSSKQSCELFTENYSKIYGVCYTILRYGSLYGKRSNSFNFINRIIRQALLEKRIQRKGDGEEIRDYINVLDAARVSVEVLEKKEYVNSYVMVTGIQTMRVKDVLGMIKEMLNDEIVLEYSTEKEEGHYEITPYSFKPRVAKKYVLNDYHDLGQGILDCIYDIYKQISKEKNSTDLEISVPKSAKY
jgi:UDP-glucose 4-epimerase